MEGTKQEAMKDRSRFEVGSEALLSFWGIGDRPSKPRARPFFVAQYCN